MSKAWDINDNTADQDEQQDMSKSGGIPASEAESNEQSTSDTDQNSEDSDDRGPNRADSGSDS